MENHVGKGWGVDILAARGSFGVPPEKQLFRPEARHTWQQLNR